MKTRIRGRPSIKVDTSTYRDPFAFTLVSYGQEICSFTMKSNSLPFVKSKDEVEHRKRLKTKAIQICN